MPTYRPHSIAQLPPIWRIVSDRIFSNLSAVGVERIGSDINSDHLTGGSKDRGESHARQTVILEYNYIQ